MNPQPQTYSILEFGSQMHVCPENVGHGGPFQNGGGRWLGI